jgi:hypothetical protein
MLKGLAGDPASGAQVLAAKENTPWWIRLGADFPAMSAGTNAMNVLL